MNSSDVWPKSRKGYPQAIHNEVAGGAVPSGQRFPLKSEEDSTVLKISNYCSSIRLHPRVRNRTVERANRAGRSLRSAGSACGQTVKPGSPRPCSDLRQRLRRHGRPSFRRVWWMLESKGPDLSCSEEATGTLVHVRTGNFAPAPHPLYRGFSREPGAGEERPRAARDRGS